MDHHNEGIQYTINCKLSNILTENIHKIFHIDNK